MFIIRIRCVILILRNNITITIYFKGKYSILQLLNIFQSTTLSQSICWLRCLFFSVCVTDKRARAHFSAGLAPLGPRENPPLWAGQMVSSSFGSGPVFLARHTCAGSCFAIMMIYERKSFFAQCGFSVWSRGWCLV